MHSMAARFLFQTGVMSRQHRWLPVALLGLVRLEQEDGRGAQHLLARVVAVRLRYDARVLRKIRGGRVIVIVDVLAGVRQHEGRMEGPVDVDEPVERMLA